MKISLITVAFNSGRAFCDTIQPVISQHSTDTEYTIVDGSSQDSTIEIIKKREPLSQGRLKWISEKDNGLYDAMNKGIHMATGNIVGIIDSDDFYHGDDVITKVIEASDSISTQAVYEGVRLASPKDSDKTVCYYPSKNFAPHLFWCGFMSAHSTFFTYRKCFEGFGCYKTDYKITADHESLICSLYVRQLKSECLPFDFMKMRTGGISTASVKSNILLNKGIIRTCRENGIWTCLSLLCLKYAVKVFELLLMKE